MKTANSIPSKPGLRKNRATRAWLLWLLLPALAVAGCKAKVAGQKQDEFFTSGSREADQRAMQRMAQAEQLSGAGEGSGEKGAKKATSGDGSAGNGTNKAARVEGKMGLFDRLGGESGISNIVADLMPRLLQDPRVNWHRQAVKRGFLRGKVEPWKPTPESIATLEKHLVQFLSLATGGPARYDGRDLASVHAGMNIGNPEFDAVLGDLKASLDQLKVPNKEQKELLALIETTRPQVVTQR